MRSTFLALGLLLALGGPLSLGGCSGPGADSRSPRAREAAALLAAERPLEAYELLYREDLESATDVDELVLYAEACFRTDQIRKGVRAADRALALDPDCHAAMYWKALLREQRLIASDGLELLERAVELAPDNLTYALARARLLEGSQQPEAAQAAYERAHALAPDDPEASRALGGILVRNGHHERGLPLLEAWLANHPEDADALYLRGVAHLRAGRNEPAEADLRRSIELAPHVPAPYYNLTRVLVVTGRREEAAETQQTYQRVSDLDRRVRALQRELAVEPDSRRVKRELAKLLEEQGRHQQARRVRQSITGTSSP